jgi:S1-C subfamily serine protease
MKKILIYNMLVLTFVFSGAYAAENTADPIVRITTSYQRDSSFYPWRKQPPRRRIGFGVVIDKNHILTTENMVRNNTLVEIQLPHSGKNITATVVKSDHQVNLALLHIVDSDAFAGINYPGFIEKLPVNSSVSITQIDETSGIQKGDGHVVKVFVGSLPKAASSLLQYDILTDLNVTGEGAPAFVDKKLAGIMISYSSGSRTGQMIPASYITRFINDVMDGSYSGFASAGVSWQQLVDPVKRKYLGVDDSENGIQVISCLPGTGAAMVLKPNDVILSWDGHSIDNLGYYIDNDYGRLLFPHLVKGGRRPGDKVTVTISRNGTEKKVQVPLSRSDESAYLIPENTTGEPCEYIVAGGLIIQELTAQMLYAYGSKWQSRIDPRLAHIFLTKQQNPDHPGDRIVLLTQVLNDPVNISYQDFRNMIITKVNGSHISNIGDVFDIIRKDGSIKTISLQGVGVDIVFDDNELKLANKRIMQQYGLPALQREIKK